MKYIFFFIISFLFFGCSKEVVIDIPGYEEQLVIDGRIETDSPPLVLLSKSKDIYSPTDINSIINNFQSGATVKVSNGTNEVTLDEICSDNLPPGTEAQFAAAFGISESELSNYNICIYSTFDMSVWGEVGKTYTLTVDFEGQQYTSQTSIVQPTYFDSIYWKPEGGYTDWGFSWVELSDPAGQFDGYFWQCKRINDGMDGEDLDGSFEPTFNPVFNDEFFDGLTFDFAYENPNNFEEEIDDEFKGLYQLGDTVVVKFSKLDPVAYEFMEKKYIQLANGGSPFAVPANIPTNIVGGALGAWIGYSPIFDTLPCYPQ